MEIKKGLQFNTQSSYKDWFIEIHATIDKDEMALGRFWFGHYWGDYQWFTFSDLRANGLLEDRIAKENQEAKEAIDKLEALGRLDGLEIIGPKIKT